MAYSTRILAHLVDSETAESAAAVLQAAGYEVIAAPERERALHMALTRLPEVVLLDGGTARRELLAALQELRHGAEPAVLVLGQEAFESDAPLLIEFLALPLRPAELTGRVAMLARLATMREELRRRCETLGTYDLALRAAPMPPARIVGARLLLVGETEGAGTRAALDESFAIFQVENVTAAMAEVNQQPFDAVLCQAADARAAAAALQFGRDLRRNNRLFTLPLVLLAPPAAVGEPEEAFTCGVTELLSDDASRDELIFRLSGQIRQRRFREVMGRLLREARHPGVCDTLTGLYRHGFLHEHLARQIEHAQFTGKPLSVGMLKLLDLPLINRRHGYFAGDTVLRQVGGIIGSLVRGEDLPARYGGDEFCVVMPDTARDEAQVVLRRLASVVNHTCFALPQGSDLLPVALQPACTPLRAGQDARSLLAAVRGLAAGTSAERADPPESLYLHAP